MMASTSRLRVVLVDDHELVRIGLRTLLDTVPTVAVVGESSTAAQAVGLVQTVQPDIVLLDMRLPDGGGAETCRAIHAVCPGARVIMLTAFADDIVPAIVAGAAGYVLKTSDVSELLDAIRVVGSGKSFLSPNVTETVLDLVRSSGRSSNTTGNDALAQLSDQDRIILPMIAEGKTNREIARNLKLSEHTVKIHVSDILGKLHVRRRSQAAAFIARRQSATQT